MLTTTLGKTRLRVSRMGLGCGGHSRLGLALGETTDHAVRVVREAIDLGVNFIDTAEAYGTEDAVGQAILGQPRDTLVISTKVGVTHGDTFLTGPELQRKFESCLRRLRTDYVDILHLHGVVPEEYQHALNVLFPTLADLKAEGKIRHIGITEAFIRDPGHKMLSRAVQPEPSSDSNSTVDRLSEEQRPWEVVMVGFSLLNPSARLRVLPHTMKNKIATLCMFAVRRALSQREALFQILEELIDRGNPEVEPVRQGGLDFVVQPGVAGSIQEAAYRFCLWEPGIDVVLSGTSNLDHLRENAKALQGPPLPQETLIRLEAAFGLIDSISGN